MKAFAAIIFATAFAIGCSDGPDREGYSEISVETSVERKIPRQLWDRIEDKSAASPATVDSHIRFVGVDVFLQEINEGVLQKPRLKIRMPAGGGELNLSDYFGDTNGSFRIDFEMPDVEEAQSIFYVSQVKKSADLDDSLGAGCGLIGDLSSGFAKWRKEGGLKLNSTRGRHARVAGGDFVIFAKQEDKTLISRVSLLDRSFPELFCKGYL